jgi:hypothetical protein
MVSFGFNDGSTRDYLIYDAAFAEELFVLARANLIGTSP